MKKAPEVWDVVERLKWGHRFEPFTDDELRTLQVYSQHARGLAERPLFSKPLRFAFASTAEKPERLQYAGEDALRSTSMHFRQLWSKEERTRFEKVHELIRTHIRGGRIDGVDLKPVLGSVMSRYQSAKAYEAMKHVWADDPMGEPKESFSAEYVIECWLYSDPFHTDDDKVKFRESWTPEGFDFTVIKAMRSVAALMWELDVLVQGALEEAEGAAVAA